MRLVDLEPRFIRYEVKVQEYEQHKADGYMSDPLHTHTDACWEKVTGPRVSYPFVDKIEDAQGITFLCPKCFAANGGSVGTHGVICWSRSRGVPEDAKPGPGRWRLDGTGFHDLTLNGDQAGGGGARSVLLTSGCQWHGFVTAGEVT